MISLYRNSNYITLSAGYIYVNAQRLDTLAYGLQLLDRNFLKTLLGCLAVY